MELNEALVILRKHKKDFEAYQRVEDALEQAVEAQKLRVDEDKKKLVLIKENSSLRSEMLKLRDSFNKAQVSTGDQIRELEGSVSAATADADNKISGEKKGLVEALADMRKDHEAEVSSFRANMVTMNDKRAALKADIESLEKRMGDLRNIVSQMAPS